MSLYNLLNGVKPATFFVLPVLGRHPEEYPRFRDCFIGDADRAGTEGKIIVYTRTGGGNRRDYAEENAAIIRMPGYLYDYDDEADSTYACFVFDVPERWADDVTRVLTGRLAETSPEYRDMVCATFPKIEGTLREMFAAAPTPPEPTPASPADGDSR